jgi:hypothetical protein
MSRLIHLNESYGLEIEMHRSPIMPVAQSRRRLRGGAAGLAAVMRFIHLGTVTYDWSRVTANENRKYGDHGRFTICLCSPMSYTAQCTQSSR